MGIEQLKMVFGFGTLGVEAALQKIQMVLANHGIPIDGFLHYDKPVSLPEVLKQLKKSDRMGFDLEGQGFEFMQGAVRNYNIEFLEIRSTDEVRIHWDDWITHFAGDTNFVMAWLADAEYEYWQNAEDPLQYTAVGKPYEHLPMKSNELPYPLEQKIVDTSANPGRWRFHDGYIEAIGAVMWLGPTFWSLTGANQEQVSNTPWLTVSSPTESVTKLLAAEHCFAASDGPSGALQDRLRSLLFPA